MQAPENFNGNIYLNPVPTEMMGKTAFFRVMRQMMRKNPGRMPEKTMGPFLVNKTLLSTLPPPGELRVTWLGHSTLLIDIDGRRILTDPVWYSRVSPFRQFGPKRFFENPLPIDQLPPIDYILLSHDHYDHLDKHAIIKLTQQGIRVLTLLGVKKRLTDWGVNPELVSELNWWDTLLLDFNFKITVAPARHFSGRWLGDRFKTLWGSFAIKGPVHNIYFGADSGYYDGFKTIGERLGPFDVAMLEIGAYNPAWENIHMGPENAVKAAKDLGSPPLLPIHWGTFNLAMHPWKEPVEKLVAEAGKEHVTLLLPAPGETLAINGQPHNSQWWTKYR